MLAQFGPPPVQISFPLIRDGFATVGGVFALVGDQVTLVCDPLTLIDGRAGSGEHFGVFAGSWPMRGGPLLDRGPTRRLVPRGDPTDQRPVNGVARPGRVAERDQHTVMGGHRLARVAEIVHDASRAPASS